MNYLKITIAASLIVIVAGCGSKPTVFLHPQYNFRFVERVAIIPFENLSSDQGAGARITQLFVTELFASEAFDIVEPGETSRVLESHSLVRTSSLTKEQIISIGKELGTQSLILGTVTESSSARAGGSTSNIVTLVIRMVETETGSTVWSAAHSEGGRGFWSSAFGTGNRSRSEVSRDCVKTIIETLIR